MKNVEQDTAISNKLEDLDKDLKNFFQNAYEKEKQFKDLDKKYGALIQSIIQNSLDEFPNKNLYLTKVFNNLGKLYLSMADYLQDPGLYTDSAKFYQYVLSISNGELGDIHEDNKEFYTNQLEESYNQLNFIKIGLVSTMSGDITKVNVIEDKLELDKLRQDTSSKLQTIEQLLWIPEDLPLEEQKTGDLAFIKESRELFEDITQKMKKFLARLTLESEMILGQPPCEYTIIGLGSMALNQITPYSDLEFALLTKSEDYKESDVKREKDYFTNLAHLIHLRVINLGETVIPKSKYGLELSSLIKTGVTFDLGGKTPLGRIDKDKPYTLIQTVKKMAEYLKNTNVHVDKILPYILETCTYIYGNKDLITQYEREVKDFLQTSNYKERALKRLKEGGAEYDYLGSGNPGISKGSIETYTPNIIDANTEGQIFNVKQDIYRLVDRLLYDFSSFYGISPKSVWDAIDQLHTEGIIATSETSKCAAENLKFAASFATILRLRTYSYHGQQKDSMDIFSSIQKVENPKIQGEFSLSVNELNEKGSFFKYYYVVSAFHKKLDEFCKKTTLHLNDKNENFFGELQLFDDSKVNIGLIYKRLLKYQEAISYFEEALKVEPESLKILGYLSHTLELLNDPKALEWTEKAIEESEKQENDISHVISLNRMVLLKLKTSDYTSAKTYVLKIKKIYDKYKLPDGDSCMPEGLINTLPMVYMNCAELLNNIADYTEARNLLSEAKKYVDTSDQLISIQIDIQEAIIHKELGEYEEAIKIYNNILPQLKEKFGDYNSNVAIIYRNLAAIYTEEKKYNKAKEELDKALEIRTYLHGSDSIEVAGCLTNLGIISKHLDDKSIEDPFKYKEAIKINERALEIYKSHLLFGNMYTDKIHILNNLGIIYHELKKYSEAEKYFEQALELDSICYGNKKSPFRANLLHDIGKILMDTDLTKAIDKFNKAVSIYDDFQERGQAFNFFDNCNIRLSLSAAYYKQKNYLQGKTVLENAIALIERNSLLTKKSHGSLEKEPILWIYKNMGKVCHKLGDCDSALASLENALQIAEEIYESTSSEIGDLLKLIGDNALENGDFIKSYDAYKRAYNIYSLTKDVYEIKLDVINKNLETSKKFKNIEAQIVATFSKLKLSKHCENAEMEITFGDINQKDLKEYCNFFLKIKSESDLEFESNKCQISLEKNNIAILRNKASILNKQVYHCNSAIYDNLILNDNNIIHLFQIAKKYYGIDGMNQLIDLGNNYKVFRIFDDLRKILGDEKAVLLYLTPNKEYLFYYTKSLLTLDQDGHQSSIPKIANIGNFPLIINENNANHQIDAQVIDFFTHSLNEFTDNIASFTNELASNLGDIALRNNYLRYQLLNYLYSEELTQINRLFAKEYVKLSAVKEMRAILQKHPFKWNQQDFKHIKKVVHPDKGGEAEDFITLNAFETQVSNNKIYENLSKKLAKNLQPYSQKLAIYAKEADIVIDLVKLYLKPSDKHMFSTIHDSVMLYNKFYPNSNFASVIPIMSTISILSQLHQEEYVKAGVSAIHGYSHYLLTTKIKYGYGSSVFLGLNSITIIYDFYNYKYMVGLFQIAAIASMHYAPLLTGSLYAIYYTGQNFYSLIQVHQDMQQQNMLGFSNLINNLWQKESNTLTIKFLEENIKQNDINKNSAYYWNLAYKMHIEEELSILAINYELLGNEIIDNLAQTKSYIVPNSIIIKSNINDETELSSNVFKVENRNLDLMLKEKFANVERDATIIQFISVDLTSCKIHGYIIDDSNDAIQYEYVESTNSELCGSIIYAE